MSDVQAQPPLFPGICPVLLRLTLAELLSTFSARVARAESGSEVSALIGQYAQACLRELEGVDSEEACELRAHFTAMAATVAP